jgi:dynein heavy chain
VNNDEWQFFLRGGLVLDKANQPNNPAPEWISEEGWDNVTALDELPHFKGVVNSFEQSITAWEDWYRSNEPEAAELPGEWESKCNELQRMIFVRSLRIDRAVFASTTYVANSLGRKFVEPPVLDLGETVNDSNPSIPLVFVLSPGVDPTANLQQLALARNHLEHFHTVRPPS